MEKVEKKLKYKFNENEKRLLIGAVKKRSPIWDKCHKLHSKRNAIKAAWKEIGKEIKKPDEACKLNWRSILDSNRYHNQKRKSSKKSGSGCNLEFLSKESDVSWEFSEDLKFLTEASELRSCSQLLSPTFFQSISTSSNDFDILPSTSTNSKKRNYSDSNAAISPKNSCLNEMRVSVSKVAEVMSTLVDVAKEQNDKNSANTPFLNYVDSLLLKLPTDVVEKAQSKIIAMLHEEISHLPKCNFFYFTL